jgi:signal transduction histidine kinase
MKDFSRKEFKKFIKIFEKKFGLSVDDPSYLYSLTKGDIYFTKVILTFCEANIVSSIDEIKKRSKIIKKAVIDKALDYILSPPTVEFVPPFRFLKNFIDQYDEVRDVLYYLNAGASIAPMTDTSGYYTIPESSGAVIKIEKDERYGYEFRNEIYRRFVEKYVKAEERKIESIIWDTIGKGDLSFPATLAAAIRHEISGPIDVISAELSRLYKSPISSSKTIEYLDAIKASNIRLSTINSFLKGLWSPKPNLEKVDFNSYIEQSVSVFKPHFSHHKIQIHFDFDKKIEVFKIDTSALGTLLVNLIINARDAILPKGGGKVTIGTKLDKKIIKLIFKDDGIGMDKYTIRNALNYGFSTKTEGQGIGLTLCMTAVRRMNAELKVESTVGQGTTITIVFRRNKDET